MANKIAKETSSSFYYKPKKVSSVIPAKRKLVKRLIFDHFVSFFISLCSPSCPVSVMYNRVIRPIHDGYGGNSNSGEAGGGDGGNNKSHQVYPLE
uniref:Uncharacterized protein n=1 Tax=Chenopodium quinoa TaxID=63459 RepID=A0A803LHK4_CHEQI